MSHSFRQAALASWLALALLVAMALPAWAQGDEFGAGSRTVDIYMTVEPKDLPEGSVQMPGQAAITAPHVPVKISGLTSREFAGQQIAVTVEPPEWEEPTFEPEVESEDECEDDNKATPLEVIARQEPTVGMAEVDVNGRFEVEFTPKVEGKHRVRARDASQVHEGEAEFEVVTIELELKCIELPVDEIEATAAELFQTVCDVTNALVEGLVTLPESPAKAEFERQLKAFNEHRAEVLGCGEAPSWSWGLRQLNDLPKVHPALAPSTAPVKRKIMDWKRDADKAASQGSKVLSQLTSGNVMCDNMDLLVNALKYVEFVMGLLVAPAKFLEDWAIENAPPKLITMIPPVGQTPAVKEGVELGWKGILSYKPTRVKGAIKIGVKGSELLNAHLKMGTALASYAASRIFEVYCQTFQGPVSGRMRAEFYSPAGDIWWWYTIDISGKLTLRYPKDAQGKVIRMTGEFTGNATNFESWDNAVPVLFPEMAQGTVFRTLRIEPLAASGFFQKNFGTPGPSVGDMNPVSSTIEQGGNIAQYVMTPAYFNVPVKAELQDKTLRLELREAIEDFDDLRVKVVQIMLPVLSLWPEVNDYALPYQGGRFIMNRAMNDGPVEFTVEQTKDTMTITKTFTRERRNGDTFGQYSLQITACNPGC